MHLQDGTGKGYEAKVDEEGRLGTFSVIEAEDRHINKENGKVWSADLDGIATNASSKATPLYIAWFQNTSGVNYHMTDMRVHLGDNVGLVDIDEVTVGTIGNNTAFLPAAVASRNVGTSVSPIGNMDYATSATGLTGLTKVANLFHAGSLDNKTSHLRTTSNIIIPPGQALAVAVRSLNATIGVTATWSLVEVPIQD
jgi:hypothetical protein